MTPRFKKLFRKNSRGQHKHTELMTQSDKDIMLPKQSSPKIDLLDTELFGYDYDLWFSKAMFQYSLARVIENEHWGHACINPRDVLQQLEATYSNSSGEDVRSDGKVDPLGHQLYERINHARAARDDETFKVFLDELSNQIRRHCRLLRNEKRVELDAEENHGHNPRRHAATPSSSTRSHSSSEDSREAHDVFEGTGRETNDTATNANLSTEEHQEPIETDSSEHGSSVQSMPIISQPGSLSSQSDSNQIPIHRYTSLLWEYGAKSGKTPTYDKEWTTQGPARCVASFDGINVVGEAPKYKDARHDASKRICEVIGIPTF